MAMGENDGYDTILHIISRYDTAPKRFAVSNVQQSKINAFARIRMRSNADTVYSRRRHSNAVQDLRQRSKFKRISEI